MLIGLVAGLGWNFVVYLSLWGSTRYGYPPDFDVGENDVLHLRFGLAMLVDFVSLSVVVATGTLFIVFLTCMLVRRDWFAAFLLISLWVAINVLRLFDIIPMSIVVFIGLQTGLVYFLVARRYGLLALTLMGFSNVLAALPLTTNLSAWYASNAYLVAGVLLALAVYAFRTSLGGQKVFTGKLLEE